MTTEPTVTAEERLAELERLMAEQARLASEQARELEQLRARDPEAAKMRALMAPRSVAPEALAREQRDRAAASARQAAAEEHARLVAEQEERDAPKRERRDAQVEELRERRDQTVADADRLYLEADRLSGEISAIQREPLSDPIPLPPILQPAPIASNGHIGTRGGRTLYMGEAAAGKLSGGQR